MTTLSQTFGGKRVLVTGHTGFKGAWLVSVLLASGAKVQGYALAPETDRGLFTRAGLADRIGHAVGDVRDLERLSAVVGEFRPEIVFHLAAQALVRRSYADPKTTFDTNLGGSVNLLEAVRACDSVKALVYVTSDKAYENSEWVWGYREIDRLGGHDPYSASKAAAEIAFSAYQRSYFANRSGFGAASARAGNVIGGGDWAEDRIVPDCVRALEAGQEIVLRNPDATRPWQHVLEPISGYLALAGRLLEQPQAYCGAWNFGPSAGNARSVHDVASGIVGVFGSGEIRVARPAVATHEAHLLQLNSDKAQQLLGWKPRWSFERTIEATAIWYREVIAGADAEVITMRQIREYFPELDG